MKQQKQLIIFYSRTGTTKKAAEAMASALKCDVEELLDKQGSKSRKGLLGWLRSGKEGMKKIAAPIEKTKNNAADYELVIIGAPNWGSNMASPVRTYLSDNKGKFKKVAFFCTSGGESPGNTFVEMEQACGKKPVACLGLRARAVKKGEHIPRIEEFAKKIKK
jgi:flavodoxin